MELTAKDLKSIKINIELATPVTPAPVKTQAKTPAPVTPAPVKTQAKTPTQVTPAPVKAETKGDPNLFWKILTAVLLGLLIFTIIWLLAGWLINKTKSSAPASAPASAPIPPSFDGALESPDERSAGSNQNFIGYFGSRGAGWVVPSQVLDTYKATRDVGSVLFTWCETRTNCFYQILKPGDTITVGHQGSQINIYSKEYMGLEANELQYIATEANTSWTAVK